MYEKPVICRLTLEIIGVAIFVGLVCLSIPISLYFETPPTKLSTLLIMGICLFFSSVIPALCFHVRCRLIADETGLEIRGLLYRRNIPWNEIRDFYYELPPPNNKSKRPLIYIEYGARKQMLSHNFKDLPALLERIEEKATHAPARKFEVKEMRDLVNAPQIFDYGNPQIWPIVLLAIVTAVAMFANMFGKVLMKNGLSGLSASFAFYSLPMKLGLIGTTLLMLALYPLMVLIAIPATKALQRFKGQQVIASATGLEWRSGANSIEITWTQIETYYFEAVKGNFQPSLCVVEGANKRISFLRKIPKGNVLVSIIRQKAVNATTSSWQFQAGRDEDTLGQPALPDSDGKITFHYRTRTNRAMLLGGTVLFLVMIVLNHFGRPAVNQQDSSALFMSIMLGIPTLYGWLAYFLSRVEVKRDGVRHITLFKQRFIAWNEITKLKCVAFYSIMSDKELVRISPFLSEPKHFQNAVAERSGKTWETPDEKTDFLIGH